ncbi:MAG: hypothetical protein ACE5FL_08675 [Myxococcota bacterium]
MSLVMIAALGVAGLSAAGESEEDEQKKYAKPGSFRTGVLNELRSVEIVVDGESKAVLKANDLDKLRHVTIFSPRGPRKSWRVVDALSSVGVETGQRIHFVSEDGKRLELEWADFVDQQERVVLVYNFKGHLVLDTDSGHELTKQTDGMDEEAVRALMHEARHKSLIFLRNVERIEVTSS